MLNAVDARPNTSNNRFRSEGMGHDWLPTRCGSFYNALQLWQGELEVVQIVADTGDAAACENLDHIRASPQLLPRCAPGFVYTICDDPQHAESWFGARQLP
jgi:hypothetical protein